MKDGHVTAVLFHFFFGTIGDKSRAVVFADLKVAEKTLWPDYGEKYTRREGGAVRMDLNVTPDLLPQSRRFADQAEVRQYPNFVTGDREVGIVAVSVSVSLLSCWISEPLSLLQTFQRLPEFTDSRLVWPNAR